MSKRTLLRSLISEPSVPYKLTILIQPQILDGTKMVSDLLKILLRSNQDKKNFFIYPLDQPNWSTAKINIFPPIVLSFLKCRTEI